MIHYLGLSLLLLVFLAPTLRAQSPSPAATEGAEVIRGRVKQKVEQELAAIKKAVAKRGFVGRVTAKADAVLTLTNLKNQSRSVTVTGDTTIKLKGLEGTLEDIKVGDFVIAMGEVDSQNTMTAKRLLVITQPAADKRRAVFGRVTAISASSITVETVRKAIFSVNVTASTKITAKSDAKVGPAKLADIKVGDRVAVVGTSDTAANTLSARRLHVIPGAAASPTP